VSNGGAMGRPQQPLEHRLLLTATFCLLAGGAVMVYSASSARTLLQGQGDGTSYLIKYLAYGGVGLIGMQVVWRLNLEHVRRFTRLLLFASFVMLVAVRLPGMGVRVNGASTKRAPFALKSSAMRSVELRWLVDVSTTIWPLPTDSRIPPLR